MRKKELINNLITFFISHKSYIETFLKYIVNDFPKVIIIITHIKYPQWHLQ